MSYETQGIHNAQSVDIYIYIYVLCIWVCMCIRVRNNTNKINKNQFWAQLQDKV